MRGVGGFKNLIVETDSMEAIEMLQNQGEGRRICHDLVRDTLSIGDGRIHCE